MRKFPFLIKLICLCLAFAFLCGCAGSSKEPAKTDATGSTSTSDKTDLPASVSTNEPVPLKIAVADHVKIEDFETNVMTRLLEEQGNFDLSFEVFPEADYNTKLNLMAMSGGTELPDVLLASPGDAMVYSWAQAGVIIPLKKYYDDPNIARNLHEAVKRTGVNFFSQIISPDGEIYGIPTFNQSYGNEFPHKLYYYEPWLKELGLNEPKTTDEFYECLKLICTSDLNKNNKQDEIGMAGTFSDNYSNGWFHWLMNAFVYAGDSNYFVVEDGKVSVAYNTQEWKEGLKYIRRLFAEKLLPVEILTQDKNQFLAMVNTEDVTSFSFSYTSPSPINATNPVRNDYVGLAPIAGPGGKQYATYRESTANISFMITRNCKNPEAAFRLGDLMISEYFSIMQRWGEEGVHWDYYKNVKNPEKYVSQYANFDIYIVAYDDDTFWGSGTVQNASWLQRGPYIRQYGIALGRGIDPQTLTPFSKNYADADIAYQSGNYKPKEYIPKLIYTAEESEKITEIMTTLRNYVLEATSNFLVGNIDIDSNWDAYVKELNAIGLDTVLEVVQKVYDRMYK